MAHGYRSGLEAKNAKHLEALGEPVLFEVFKVPYVIPAAKHTYTVDFRLRNGILVETKGRWLSADRAKHLFVRLQYPDLDIRLVFDNPKSKIGPSSSTTVAEWADKHGFVWAVKTIPEEWTREKGPEVSPEEALRKGPQGFQDLLKQERKRK
ncbi:hypothetical protein [Methylobacterium ajmalii]|jgi:hypothetical protein|uniref:hypothetical protein n=1 Tax=Methylobacterium ajmalii TaxID=2738439 RepID=UPI00190AFD87|nr:hypothetical protein [Methylobacterium ajmalii]MBK3400397.1 endonuclease I [Methylobacterium ajmalii]MBK3407561.1 endonuclease I [Methylobacterium ajmalii]MBK3422090.1 endonuclease I [Methylobacterium ajmalii]MBZ6415639.1 hypothetical protein [Methylobacterium sp.]